VAIERVPPFPGGCLGALLTPQQPRPQCHSIESVRRIFWVTSHDDFNRYRDCPVRNTGSQLIRIPFCVRKTYGAISSMTGKVTQLQSLTIWSFFHTWPPRLQKKNPENERMKFCCVWGGSTSSWITLRQEFKHLIQVEDSETGRCQKNECWSETRLEEKEVENRVICLEQNNCWIVSLSVPEETSWSAPNICKPSSKQSLLSKASGSHTVDSDATSVSRSWYIATNIRWNAEIIRSQLGQATINNLRGRIWKSNCMQASTEVASLGLIRPGLIISSITWDCDDWRIWYWR
jgi:hypothetical protein